MAARLSGSSKTMEVRPIRSRTLGPVRSSRILVGERRGPRSSPRPRYGRCCAATAPSRRFRLDPASGVYRINLRVIEAGVIGSVAA